MYGIWGNGTGAVRFGASCSIYTQEHRGLGLMKRTALILGIIFLILTFVGGGYVLINHGQVNAGYAVVPGIWAMICFGFYRSGKRD